METFPEELDTGDVVGDVVGAAVEVADGEEVGEGAAVTEGEEVGAGVEVAAGFVILLNVFDKSIYATIDTTRITITPIVR